MIALIPKWKNSTHNYDFDSIINIARIYRDQSEKKFELTVLNYMPDLRRFLHEYGLYEVETWNVFDSIQNIQISEGSPISFNDLTWPVKIDAIYQPYRILVTSKGQVFAHVLISKYGFVEKVVYFRNSNVSKIYYYDDRGFVSRKKFISSQGEINQYFDEYEHLVFQEKNNMLSIQSDFLGHFKKREYTSLEDLALEKYEEHLKKRLKSSDRILMDVSKENINFSRSKLNKITYLISSEESVDDLIYETNKIDVNGIEALIFTNQFLLKIFNKRSLLSSDENRIKKLVITPYKTELSLGMSSEMENNIVYVYANETEYSDLGFLIEKFISYIEKYPDTEFYINTKHLTDSNQLLFDLKVLIERKFLINTESQNFKIVQEYIDAKKEDRFYTYQQVQRKKLEAEGVWEKLAEAVNLVKKFKIFCDESKGKFNDDFNMSRLYVDLGDIPNHYLQTLAISYGIPQVVKSKNQFLVEGKNGLLINNNEFLSLITYFIENLNNWNLSLVQNVSLINKFSQDNLLELWDGDF